jgi:phosphatidylinositol 4-phosphatase
MLHSVCSNAVLRAGAYIISPLEEVSQDREQNAGFTISWLSSKQHTRATSYTVRNSLDALPVFPGSQAEQAQQAQQQQQPGREATTASRTLSNLLVANTPVPGSETTFAAFKVLPIDRARTRRTTGSFIEPADEFAGAKSCKEAVDMMVDMIVSACEESGSARREGFVVEGDVVR